MKFQRTALSLLLAGSEFATGLGDPSAGLDDPCRFARQVQERVLADKTESYPHFDALVAAISNSGHCGGWNQSEVTAVCRRPASRLPGNEKDGAQNCCGPEFHDSLRAFSSRKDCLFRAIVDMPMLGALLSDGDITAGRAPRISSAMPHTCGEKKTLLSSVDRLRVASRSTDIPKILRRAYTDEARLLHSVQSSLLQVSNAFYHKGFRDAIGRMQSFTNDVMCSACDPEMAQRAVGSSGHVTIFKVSVKRFEKLKKELLGDLQVPLTQVGRFFEEADRAGGWIERSIEMKQQHFGALITLIGQRVAGNPKEFEAAMLEEARRISTAFDFLEDLGPSDVAQVRPPRPAAAALTESNWSFPFAEEGLLASPPSNLKSQLRWELRRCGKLLHFWKAKADGRLEHRPDVGQVARGLESALSELSLHDLLIGFGLGPQLCVFDVVTNVLALAPDPRLDVRLLNVTVHAKGARGAELANALGGMDGDGRLQGTQLRALLEDLFRSLSRHMQSQKLRLMEIDGVLSRLRWAPEGGAAPPPRQASFLETQGRLEPGPEPVVKSSLPPTGGGEETVVVFSSEGVDPEGRSLHSGGEVQSKASLLCAVVGAVGLAL